MNTSDPFSLVAEVEVIIKGVCSEVDAPTDVGSTSIKASRGDLVTALDREIERRLADHLTHLVAGSVVLGEEHGGTIASGPTWIIDPIDGTANVVHGFPHAAVSVALWENRHASTAVVYHLFRPVTYAAVRERGAFERSRAGNRPLHVSDVDDLSRAIIGFGLPHDRTQADEMFTIAERLFHSSQDLRRSGSAVLDMIDVAVGALDAYVELDLRIWDVAAAGLILTEAGGQLTGWTAEPLNWGDGSRKLKVAATNGLIHADVLHAIASARDTLDSSRVVTGRPRRP
jgi:myo-inositol-1(or 4)-monophosphatase